MLLKEGEIDPQPPSAPPKRSSKTIQEKRKCIFKPSSDRPRQEGGSSGRERTWHDGSEFDTPIPFSKGALSLIGSVGRPAAAKLGMQAT